jgi:pyruvate ferredoxin oxidoreductase alpha subunit
MKKLIETSDAVARAAMLARPSVVPMYPITPQTHIVERLASFISDGKLNAEIIHCESEHSAISAAIGASAAGARVFTATASQGLALMHEIVFIASGMRIPIVMAVANRALSAPINIWNDQQDSISERDSGWIQLYVETAQEALDTTIMAYKIAENRDVLLPVMVCLDGFTLSHVFEAADIPEQNEVDRFLPKYGPTDKLDPKNPKSFGPISFPNTFTGFRKMQDEAMERSAGIIEKVNSEFKKSFSRSYGDGLVETYLIEDAEYALVALGSTCGTIRAVVDEMRSQGRKYGMIKVKCLRPFPRKEIIEASKNLRGIAVLDRNIAPGAGGAVFTEIKAILTEKKISGVILGLGGKDIKIEDIKKSFEIAEKADGTTEWLI